MLPRRNLVANLKFNAPGRAKTMEVFMEKNTIFNEVVKIMTTKESVKIMRDATAVSVAGSVVGIAIRNSLYRRSKAKGGWYAKYIDLPICTKWCNADDKSVLVSAVIATALDTVLMLDRYGAIKLRSIEDSEEDLENDCKSTHEKAYNAYKAEMAASAEKTAEAVPPSRDDTDDDEDEYAPY